MGSEARFQFFDDQAKLHDGQESLRWAQGRDKAKEAERYYTGRLVRGLEALGIGPVGVNGANDGTDISVAGWAVEVKIARARERPRRHGQDRAEYYQALLWEPKTAKRGRRILHGSFVILACVDLEDRLWPFVIPRSAIGSRRTLEISSRPDRYTGQWARFLGAFDYLTDEPKREGVDDV